MIAQFRLASLSLAARITVTAFLALVGSGYLVAATKIYLWHNMADGVPGMSLDDLKAVYHGLDKTVTAEVRETLVAPMLYEVGTGGGMRKNLLKGGETAERALIAWLKAGAKPETFDKPGFVRQGDPSALQVIAERCILCHNATDGDERDIPYAASAKSEPQYELVAKKAVAPLGQTTQRTDVRHIEPMSTRELVHLTHAHILAIPVFTLVVAGLFLHTGVGPVTKLLIAPLPMMATCVDIGCWWLARPFEPAIYGIAAAGTVFSLAFGLQILYVLGSMWFGGKTESESL